MEIYELSDEEFRIILLKKFGKLQENIGRQLKEIGKMTHEQNKNFDKEIAVIKKQTTKKQQ